MIAIIPARGGSKGLPGKNIKELAGYPLIYYTIKAAKEANSIDRIIVSTDDKKIADIASNFGAEIPFLRPEELAADHSKAIDNYIYTVDRLNQTRTIAIDEFIVLQPTSPLRTSKDIDNAIELFYKMKAETVISVVKAEHPPTWYKKISPDGILIDYYTSVDNSQNRQEEEVTFLPNGAIFVFNFNALKKNCGYYNSKTYPYVMPQENSVDIDTPIDFQLAELLLKSKRNELI
ncbi:acylneuraminate cytidylyltransferase family protein [Anaerocolumna sedimenticola]|uniref:Acylneuraminate cytidylyltransferase family protein n=1 Tax=Anaerocolumna sedimenticola TaxID=2696063 RepID=A0A6P1TMY2_9FIRM|nr:acylneuraminate cytidylyltransferase family protein [Anaerocolumna sedimenticola]QHQ60698.1 acylneuraminate cytidylyltransferase family protein [Anaerocolumna sedimenticola]